MIDRIIYSTALALTLGIISFLEGERVELLARIAFVIGAGLFAYSLQAIVTVVCIAGHNKESNRQRYSIFAGMMSVLILSYVNQINLKIKEVEHIAESRKEKISEKELKTKPPIPEPIYYCRKKEGKELEDCNKNYRAALSDVRKLNIPIEKDNELLRTDFALYLKQKEDSEKKNLTIKPDYSEVIILALSGIAFSLILSVASMVLIDKLSEQLRKLHRDWKAFKRLERIGAIKEKKENEFWNSLSQKQQVYLLTIHLSKSFPEKSKTEIMELVGKRLEISSATAYRELSRNGIEFQLKEKIK